MRAIQTFFTNDVYVSVHLAQVDGVTPVTQLALLLMINICATSTIALKA
jgi:hypothetical protein